MTTTTIELRYAKAGKFHAFLDGERITDNATRRPILAACRALVARGITGRLEWRHGAGHIAGHIADLAAGAKLTVYETDRAGLFITRWRPFSGDSDPATCHSDKDGQDDLAGTEGLIGEDAAPGMDAVPLARSSKKATRSPRKNKQAVADFA